jgi:anti-sigma factor RsiW
MLRCHAVQTHLTAYIHNELPLKARRRVAAHLERCSRCQSAYQRQRTQVHELEREIPRIGQSHQGQLARIWSKVQTELHTPTTPRPSFRYRAAYGLAAVILMVAMVVPYALSRNEIPATATRTLPARAVAFATVLPDNHALIVLPENALSRTAPAVTRSRVISYVTPQAALTPAPRP